MILRSIELENFGKFRGQNFELRRGMNLVIGPNEAGKSTFVEAIPAVLFGSREVERYKPWGRNACAAKLVFENRDRTVEIRRDLLSDEVRLVERDDLYHTLTEFNGRVAVRGRNANFQEYRELLTRLLGIGDEDLFRATCFFGHRPMEWTGEELAQKLRSLIGSGAGDYAEIMDRLLEEHFALTRINPWGRDKQRDRELEDLERQLAATAPTGATTAPAAADRPARLQALQEEIDRDREEYARGVKYIEQVRRKIEAQTISSVTSRSTAAGSEDQPADQPRPATPGLKARLAEAGLPDTLPAELPQILEEAAQIRQELAELQQPMVRLKQQEGRLLPAPWLPVGIGTLLLAGVAGVAWWQQLQPVWVSAGCGLAGLGLWLWAGQRHLKARRAAATCQAERQRLEQKRAVLQQRQAELTERCEALGLPSSAVDLVRLQKQVAQHRELLDELWHQGTAAPVGTPGGQGGPPRPVAGGAPPGQGESEEIQELERLEERLAEFAEQLQRREKELETLQQQAASAPGAEVEPAAERQDLNERMAAVERRIAVLRHAIELLAEGIERYAKSDLHQLVAEVSRLFGKVTRGRYPAVRLDSDMHPQIQTGERRWQPIERFSRGTVDALYLALRVALARVRGDGRSLPLMLDDPFAHLDQKRLTAALHMVDLAAAEGQMILLSHNPELARRAARERWHVVALDEELAAAETEGEEGDHAGQLHLL